jgi:hypothetical protein
MYKSVLVVAALTTFSSLGANAANFSLGGRLGLSGAGVEATAKFSDHLGVRAHLTGLKYSLDLEYDDIEYQVETNLAIGSLLLDVHPMGGKFRITLGGAAYNGQFGISAVTSPSYLYQIGNNFYTSAQIGTLNGEIEYRKVVPYVGVGWDFGVRKKSGFGVTLDLGVFFRGKPDDVTFTASGGGVSAADLALERNNIEDDTEGYHHAVAVGLYYRF